MKITNVEIMGLKSSAKAGGYPMMASIPDGYLFSASTEKDEKRFKSLSSAKSGSGHDSMLKGIVIQYDLTCNHVMLPQFMRYHFHDITSSQSKMHRITEMKLSEVCDKYVLQSIIDIVQGEIEHYSHMKRQGYNSKEELAEQYEKIMSNLPMGMELTMRITSNYLQLKSIFNQRENHRMSFWRDYCKWVLGLPMMSIVLKR